MKSKNFRSLLAASTLLCLTMSSGCITINPFVAQPSAEQVQVDPSQTYTVYMNSKGTGQGYHGVLADEAVYVQDALELSGATRKYRNMKIRVLRSVDGSGRVLNMPVNYNASRKLVEDETNYAVHPGDKILVSRKFDNAVESVVKTLGR